MSCNHDCHQGKHCKCGQPWVMVDAAYAVTIVLLLYFISLVYWSYA